MGKSFFVKANNIMENIYVENIFFITPTFLLKECILIAEYVCPQNGNKNETSKGRKNKYIQNSKFCNKILKVNSSDWWVGVEFQKLHETQFLHFIIINMHKKSSAILLRECNTIANLQRHRNLQFLTYFLFFIPHFPECFFRDPRCKCSSLFFCLCYFPSHFSWWSARRRRILPYE